MFVKFKVLILFFLHCHGYELKQVIVLSRHNIGAPIELNLENLTPKKWPSWNVGAGSLTPKGRLLERSMGKYFSDWMIKENLLDSNCSKDQVLLYANTIPRVRETAESFSEGAFGHCVEVYHKNTIELDPIFRSIIRNASVEYKKSVLKEIKKKLDSSDLRKAFLELNRMVDFNNSSYCKTEKICDLNYIKNEICFEVNKSPFILGGITFGLNLVDSFLMQFHNGMALDKVAWGQIQTTQQWETLISIITAFHEIRLIPSKRFAKDLASPLLEYLTDIFQNGKRKFYLLVGQDVNIIVLMSSLNFKDYALHDQLEKTPIGGKLVFQKWYDRENDQDLLRVNYVYFSMKQLRDGAEISLQNPPQWQLMEMENCAIDENGFCLWKDFVKILNNRA